MVKNIEGEKEKNIFFFKKNYLALVVTSPVSFLHMSSFHCQPLNNVSSIYLIN